MKNKAVVAVARELAGFVWAIGCEVQTSGWRGVKSPAWQRPDTEGTAQRNEDTGGEATKTDQMPEGERGAAAATGESSTTLLVNLARLCAGEAISVPRPRAKAAPRRIPVLR